MKKVFEVICAASLILGMIFRLFNWLGGEMFLVFSLGLFMPIYFISELVSQWKSTTSKFLLVLNCMAIITLTQGFFYKAMHWPGSDILLIFSLWFLWPIYFIVKGILQRKEIKGILIKGILYSIFPIAILFDLMHWPGVDVLLVFSFGILLILVISSLLRKESGQLININFSDNNTKITTLVIFICLFLYSDRYISKGVLSTEHYVQLDLQEKFKLEKRQGDRYINEKNKSKANSINAETIKLIHLIDDVKLEIIRTVDRIEFNSSEIKPYYEQAVLWKLSNPKKLELSEINLLAVENKFNLDVPAHMILGSNIRVMDARLSGAKIWKSFLAYQKSLLKGLESTNSLSKKVTAEYQNMREIYSYWKAKEYVAYYDAKNVNWMARTFDHQTVLQSIVKLTEMQLEIIRMRNLALSGL